MTNMHYIECKTKEVNISLSKLNLTLSILLVKQQSNTIVLNLSIVATVNNWPKTKIIFRHMHMSKLELSHVWKSIALL